MARSQYRKSPEQASASRIEQAARGYKSKAVGGSDMQGTGLTVYPPDPAELSAVARLVSDRFENRAWPDVPGLGQVMAAWYLEVILP